MKFLKRALDVLWLAIRRYFVAGLVAFAPILITIWAIAWIVGWLDGLLLPQVMRWVFPGMEPPMKPPPFAGVLFSFIVILGAGVFVRHLFGQELVRAWERLLSRVPIARSIYGGVKQLFEAIISSQDTSASFNRVVLVEYPRKGLFALAFTTGPVKGSLQSALGDEPMVNCFVPTTPNPTSGFYLIVPERDLREVSLSVEDAFKVIMSAGLVTPSDLPRYATGAESA